MSEDKELDETTDDISDKEFEDLQNAYDKAMKSKIERDQERAENDSNRIETKVEKDQEQANNESGRIETLEKENDVLKDRCMRLQADFENQKKQDVKTNADKILKNKLKVLEDFMTIYEDFIRAENSVSKNNVDTSGIKAIRNKMEKILMEKHKIKPIDATKGKPFDRDIHEAVQVVEDDSVDEDTILQEVSKGYYAEEGILKPSMVIVSKKKSEK